MNDTPDTGNVLKNSIKPEIIMSRTATLRTVASALLLSLTAVGATHAATSTGTHAGDRYGYEYRVRNADPYSDGARFVADGHAGDHYGYQFRSADVYTDGARTVAGLDNSGVSASPARSFNPYTDGAHA